MKKKSNLLIREVIIGIFVLTFFTLLNANLVSAVGDTVFQQTATGFIVVAMLYTIALIGFFGRSEWVAMLGGLGLLAVGIFIFTDGIVAYKNFYTHTFALTTMGLGAMFSIMSGMSIIEENL